MQISYELTPEDYFKFSKENAPSQSFYKPLSAIFLTLYIVFILADVIYSLVFGAPDEFDLNALFVSILIRTALMLISVLIVLSVIKVYTMFVAKKVSEAPKNGLFCEHRIILTENELIELTDYNTARYSWKSIGEIKEFESFVSIEILMSSVYVIPKRYFQNQKHISDFIQKAKFFQQNAEHTFQPSHFIEYEKSLE